MISIHHTDYILRSPRIILSSRPGTRGPIVIASTHYHLISTPSPSPSCRPFIYSSPVRSACYLLTHAPHFLQFISRKRSCLRSSSRHTLHVDVLVPAHQLPVRKYTYVILSLAASVSSSLFPLFSSDSFVARIFSGCWIMFCSVFSLEVVATCCPTVIIYYLHLSVLLISCRP